jgi:hypothetical protein
VSLELRIIGKHQNGPDVGDAEAVKTPGEVSVSRKCRVGLSEQATKPSTVRLVHSFTKVSDPLRHKPIWQAGAKQISADLATQERVDEDAFRPAVN